MKKGISFNKGLILFDYRLSNELKDLNLNELKFYKKKINKLFDKFIMIRENEKK